MIEASLNPPDSEGLMMCDLVMKGGITSGVVYPPAVIELKKRYRFRHIGGTSAGAIAAAFTAAAEFNREKGGFDEIQKLSDWLGTGDNLRNLFQASEDTQPLMDILNVLLDRPQKVNSPASGTGSTALPGNGNLNTGTTRPRASGLSTLRNVLQFFGKLTPAWRKSFPAYKRGASRGMWLGIGAGIVLALFVSMILFTVLSLVAPGNGLNTFVFIISLLVLGIILALLGGLRGSRVGGSLGALVGIIDIFNIKMPQTYYGVCPGHTEGVESPNVLADWLHTGIEKVAGLEHDGPLTFGQLRKKEIELMMVTTNLSHQQPYIMPSGLANFVFNEKDMFALFPDDIVKHMINYPPANSIIPKDRLPRGSHFLPDEDNLPILLCTRMSLSFPLLLSALPLYTIRASALQNMEKGVPPQLTSDDLQKNWFSDGGICSNFPIQFFDAWLPKYPTFGINLTSLPQETFAGPAQIAAQLPAGATPGKEDSGDVRQLNSASFSALDKRHTHRASATTPQDVYIPQPEDLQDPQWQQLPNLSRFLVAIFRTAQNYRDNMQASLPSYRERVVQIRLNKDEGGLNLNMPPETIAAIAKKGRLAGKLMTNPHKFNFDHHWWVRFLVVMAQLEQNLEAIEGVLDSPGFDQRLEQQLCSDVAQKLAYPYCRDEQWCEEAKKRIAELRILIKHWEDAHKHSSIPHLFSENAPLPQPVLRVTPEF